VVIKHEMFCQVNLHGMENMFFPFFKKIYMAVTFIFLPVDSLGFFSKQPKVLTYNL
jgi:hypothetical protein